MKCRDIVEILERLAPVKLAEPWDNVGLLIGDMNQEIKNIMVTLDITSQVAQEAAERKADMIISHHPFIFKPLKRITEDDYTGSVVRMLIRNNISVYAAHTNLDIAWGGLNDALAKRFGLNKVTPLHTISSQSYKKLVVFVPKGYEDVVREAMSREGAGWIGNYSDCTFMASGIGTYKPLEGTNPFSGTVGKLEKAEEIRIETIVSSEKLGKVVRSMLNAHPYEEVAYDIYPLELKGEETGIGRVGLLKEAVTLEQLIKNIKKELGISYLRYVGDKEKEIKKIAICSGSGAEYIPDCVRQKVDVYITGDIKYHDAQSAEHAGLCLIDAGHFETEHIVGSLLADYLSGILPEGSVHVFCSQKHRNIMKMI